MEADRGRRYASRSGFSIRYISGIIVNRVGVSEWTVATINRGHRSDPGWQRLGSPQDQHYARGIREGAQDATPIVDIVQAGPVKAYYYRFSDQLPADSKQVFADAVQV